MTPNQTQNDITDVVPKCPAGAKQRQHSHDLRARIVALRATQSARAVAQALGVPLGTVKAVYSRSGANRDNPRLREFFKLPEIKPSECTAVAIRPPLPPKPKPSGDADIDAVVWLRQVIETGDDEYIGMALEAAKQIKTPLKQIEKRYASMALDIAVLLHGRDAAWTVALSTMGWGDLENKASRILEQKAKQRDALARFGSESATFDTLGPEQFCVDSLALVPKEEEGIWPFDKELTNAAFAQQTDLAPHTLADCIYEYEFWDALYSLRNAWSYGDHLPEVYAREDYLFHCMAHIKPRTREEAKMVLHWMQEHEAMDRTGCDAVLDNIIG